MVYKHSISDQVYGAMENATLRTFRSKKTGKEIFVTDADHINWVMVYRHIGSRASRRLSFLQFKAVYELAE